MRNFTQSFSKSLQDSFVQKKHKPLEGVSTLQRFLAVSLTLWAVFSFCTLGFGASRTSNENRISMVQTIDAYASAGLPAPKVTSDKDDYAPGEVAHISGSGWTLDQQVHVEFKEEPEYPDYHVYDVVVNPDGTWNIDYQVEERHLGVKFTVTSVGNKTGTRVSYIFTDGNSKLSLANLEGDYKGTVNLVATLLVQGTQSNNNPIPNRTIYFKMNGADIGSANTGTDGRAFLNNVSLGALNAGNHANAFTAEFKTDPGATQSSTSLYFGSIGSANLKINKLTPQFSNLSTSNTVSFGTASLILTGKLATITGEPAIGAVTATINGIISPSASLDGTGNFSIAFNPASIPANTTAYTINYSYGGSTNFNDVSNASTTLMVTKASASMLLNNLVHTYDGSAKTALVTTTPQGLSGITVSYTGIVGTPTEAGSYIFTATLNNTNYSADPVSGTLTILKATPTISLTVGNNPTYDGQAHYVANATVTGVNGSSLGNAAVAYTKGSPAVAVSDPTEAGTYSVTVTYAETANYTAATPKTGSLTIDKANAVINVAGYTGIYDGQAHGASGTIIGVGNENIGSSLTLGDTFTNAPGGTANWTFNGGNNYNDQSGSVAIVINKAPATLSFGQMDYTYDGNEKVVTASVSPNVDGLTVSGKGTNVGNYAATASLSNQNYEATSITEWLRITVAPSLVTMDDVSTTYSGQAHAASAKATGVGGLETTSGIAYSYVGDGTTTYGPSEQAPKNAGSYLVTATFAGDENHSGNMATAKVTIAKALATISMQGKTVEYDGQAHKATGSANGVEDEDLTALLNVGNAFTNVPGGTANWTFAGNGNYEPASGSKGIVITPKAASVTVASLSKTYGDQDPELTGAVTGFVPADNISAAYSRLGGETVDDGPYAISAILSPSEKLGNYTITNTLGKLTILPRAVTVAAEAKSKTYGDADPALTYGIKAGNLVNGDGFVGSLTRAEGEDVKSYAIGQGSLALSSNYNLTYEGANLTITKRGIAIAAVASSKTYGDDDPALTYNITSGNLVYDDAFTGSLSREGGENVGSYSINQGSLAVSSNYHVSFTGANFEIGKRSVTITADAKSKTYGEADPALTYQLTAGSLAFMDKVTGGLSRVPNENVGDHDIQQGSVALNDNYNLTYEGATLTIGARAITITADAKSKVYGENDPELTYKITAGSLAFEDAISGSLSRATGANVGTYAIGQGTVALNANYALSYQGANLTITARPITVTADAKAKMHGQVDPTLTYQITSGNLVAGDGFTGAISREGGTEPGVYSIQQNTLTAGTNYGLTYVPASFTIHAIPTVVIANPAPTEIGKVVNVSAAFTNDIFEPKWVWGFISPTNGTVTGTTINGSTTVPTNTGVYTLTLQYKNAIGEVKTSPEAYLAVYDPAGGFVTGGGWINSPEGALVSSPGTVGKANFGFVSKYKKGTNTVEGNTEFQFTAGNVNFKSASHTAGTLVIAGSKATYKGTGFINGGTDAHDFMVVATDGQVNGGGGSDKFRIKIWKRGGEVVYDNQMSTAENAELAPTTILGGGSIVIHEVVKGTKTSSVVALADQPSAKGKFISYPNPFSDRTTFEFAFDQDEEYSLMVYSMNGALVKNITAGKALANTPVQVQWGDNSVNVGVYLVRLVTSKGTQTLRVIRK